MRIIPKKTKVSTEFFHGVSLTDILVGFFGVLVLFFVFLSTLPGKLWIALVLLFIFALLLARIDDEPLYMFLIQLLRHVSHDRRYQKITQETIVEPLPQKQKKVKAKGKPRRTKDKKKSDSTPSEQVEEQASVLDDPNFELATGVLAQDVEEAPVDPDDLDQAKPLTRKELHLAEKAKKRAAKQAKQAKKAEDKFLKSKKVSEEEKAPIRERRKREAEERYYQGKIAEQKRNRKDIHLMTKITEIYGGFICYGGDYYGAAIEIPAVEFRFFSPHRRTNAIDRSLGSVIRSVSAKFSANLVKIERPMVLDQYIQGEYDKIEALKRSYERGVFSEEELKARVEVVYDRITSLRTRNEDEKVLTPHFYLVFFDSDKRQLENQVQSALSTLQQGEMTPHRLDDKELAVFLRYTNNADFDEREIDTLDSADYIRFALPESLEIKLRTTEVNSIITHNFRVLNYPMEVDDAWGAPLFDMPGTKVVMKFSQMDRDKSIRAIDRSISELNSQLEKTSISSRVIELQTHIETLSELLVMLQNNNEALMAMNIYVTAYDISRTRDDKLLVPQPPPSVLPRISGMKKDLKRSFNEHGFKLTDLTAQQFEAYVATQVNGYDPFLKKARGVPSSTLAGIFPWIYANLSDPKGLNLGSSDGVPTFVDFFRRDSERVNSNMVIVGKSGGGKSYATKSILTNLAADDAKIFVLDPENEYTELAGNLKGKFINVANASHGRINPFHIITSLEDDEATDGQETSSYAAHLQFLEEFFRQILPEIDSDAMEYLNNLINRIYNQKGIDQYTNLTALKPEDYPIFDDLYDCILEEFQRTKSDYLKTNLRVLMNYVAKFSTGGRNANIWNGPSTLSTVENFIVFNFQALLANRNNTIANAQMLLVLKYLDNEIIKNREYNIKYGASRKVIIVIDEAHVFIDVKYPLALDFMFQLAKRIRKYNGMQIVITQNIKDFVGSEELARKSTAIINACQYSFIFSLAPNDMHDLCTLYEKAGGINESEQEQIISAPRGQAFVVTSPTSRSSIRIETPKPVEEMFSNPIYATHYFGSESGQEAWEETLAASRPAREEWEATQAAVRSPSPVAQEETLPNFRSTGIDLVEMDEEEEEILLMDDTLSAPAETASEQEPNRRSAVPFLLEDDMLPNENDSIFTPANLQRYGFEALVQQVLHSVREELDMQKTEVSATASSVVEAAVPAAVAAEQPAATTAEAPVPSAPIDWFSSANESSGAASSDWFTPTSKPSDTTALDWSASSQSEPASDSSVSLDALFAAPPTLTETQEEPEESTPAWDSSAFDFLFSTPDSSTPTDSAATAEDTAEPAEPEERPLVYEITLEQLIAMKD